MMCPDVSLAHEHLMVVMLIFRVLIVNFSVHILSLDMIGHGVTWQRI